MMAQTKRIYILMIKVNKLFFLFLSRYFLKEIENIFSVFLWSFSLNLLVFYHEWPLRLVNKIYLQTKHGRNIHIQISTLEARNIKEGAY